MDPLGQNGNRPRVLDPSGERCPDYELVAFAAIRQAMTANGNMNDEQAVQALRESWQTHHNAQIQAWQVQSLEDRRLAEEEEQRAREEEEALRAEEQRAAAEEQKTLDKKKPKLATVDPSRRPPTQLRQRVAEYAREKLMKLAYVELDYFTAKTRQLAESQAKSVVNKTYTLVSGDTGLSLTPASSLKAIKGVRRDADLPFEEMTTAWPVFIQEITDLPEIWPQPIVQQYLRFFLQIVGHQDSQDPIGQPALMRYMEEVRTDWHEKIIARNVSDQTYNIGVFEPKLYEQCKAEIQSTSARLQIQRVRLPLCLFNSSNLR
ncbi:uncharacterized protein C8Q71DRAFT_832891 [Rhodofomes roseus]|uniref:Uncharacterized protein n=1 Tax=Rhodofomes roseus TaxID=34475 RepID=A0ABQ8KL59_9APHY|nr:uncharacterized protein C8Q71DRAFT_832891 [Rhodofomes roseus]KAH9838638.1 hypothetical protein C8Q71DRAFT_832891 [Rhodofomes roseus]